MDVQGWVVGGLALALFAYLVPHLVATRQQFADSRVDDRFSTGLRVVRTGATPRPERHERHEHHGTTGRPYLHDPRRRTEGPAVNRPTTPGERAAAEARRLATARAARAAEISRRQAAARRRLALTTVLLVLSISGWVGFGMASWSIALGIVPTVLLGAVLVAGRRAAKIAGRRNAAARAAMARMAPKPAPRSVRTRTTTANAAPGDRAGLAGEAGADSTAAVSSGVDGAGEGEATAADETADGAAAASRTWTPVPVPAPSYTLRPRAPRRDIAPYRSSDEVPVATPAAPVAGSPEAPVAGSPAVAAAGAPAVAVTGSPEAGPADGSSEAAPAAGAPAAAEAAAAAASEAAPMAESAASATGAESPTAPVAEAGAALAAMAASGLAGSPYAPLADPEPAGVRVAGATAAAEDPAAKPAAQLDIDSVLARRRALGA